MFDDQPINNNNNQIPNNLPVGEPEDVFASVEKEENLIKSFSQPASAVDVGILKPKSPTPVDLPPVMDNFSNLQSPVNYQPEAPMEMNTIKEPKTTRGIMIAVIVLVMVFVLGALGWWFYNNFVNVDDDSLPVDNTVDLVIPSGLSNEEDQILIDERFDDIQEEIPENNDGSSELSQDIVDEQILFGEPIDKDADGLDDNRETDVGTDPNNWDTDGDELSDGDEVIIWKTDPLNPDSDGDSYLDGSEVKSGYNPAGSGKIFEVPNE